MFGWLSRAAAPDLAPEPLQVLGVVLAAEPLRGDDLEGDQSVQAGLSGLVDDPHAAAVERPDDLEAGQLVAGLEFGSRPRRARLTVGLLAAWMLGVQTGQISRMSAGTGPGWGVPSCARRGIAASGKPCTASRVRGDSGGRMPGTRSRSRGCPTLVIGPDGRLC